MDDQHCEGTHARWIERSNRRTDDPVHLEQWPFEQCGGCLFWLALEGQLGADWGACTSPVSPSDGRVRFEHDGCEYFTEDPEGFGVTRG